MNLVRFHMGDTMAGDRDSGETLSHNHNAQYHASQGGCQMADAVEAHHPNILALTVRVCVLMAYGLWLMVVLVCAC